MQEGTGMPAHFRPRAYTDKQPDTFLSGAYNAEKAMTWTDQGLHFWEETFTLVSAVNA